MRGGRLMKGKDKPRPPSNHTAIVHPPVQPGKRKGSKVIGIFK